MITWMVITRPILEFQHTIFYVVSDDPDWAKHFFERSLAKDSDTYFIGSGGHQNRFHSDQSFGDIDQTGTKRV